MSNDQFEAPGVGPGPFTWYRRGTEPAEWVFDQTPINIEVGERKEGLIEYLHMDLYSPVIKTTGTYEFRLFCKGEPDPYGNPYTLGYQLYVYAQDEQTCLSDVWDVNSPEAKVLTLNPDEPVYIILDTSEGEGPYTYAIQVLNY